MLADVSGRRDYYHDPNAPAANSLVPGGSALVVDEHGRVLTQRRSDSGNCRYPAGSWTSAKPLGSVSSAKSIVIGGAALDSMLVAIEQILAAGGLGCGRCRRRRA